MDYRIIDYKDASVQMASFEGKEGCGEYHLLARVSLEGSFQQQLDLLHNALDKAVEDECKGAVPVFIRYFLSDISNQAELLYKSLEGHLNCAVSVIGQPPLDGSKVAVWVYLVTDAENIRLEDSLWSADYLGHAHLWLGSASEEEGDSEIQTARLLDSYDEALKAQGCDIAGNCIRTWLFVQDVDVNYAGVVVGRRNKFAQIGLTENTHYIASTGIAGSNEFRDSSVTMDAYAVKDISPEQITYLKGSTHLNPTHEYGVTFERGTAVDYEDRRHIFISGTASIDNKGEILHPGDVCRQTGRMWENVEVLLAEAGAGFDDVAQMIVYLRDIADYQAVRKMYEARFPNHPKVFLWASVCRPGWLVEMECIAVKGI